MCPVTPEDCTPSITITSQSSETDFEAPRESPISGSTTYYAHGSVYPLRPESGLGSLGRR